jgi:hypothetical protein
MTLSKESDTKKKASAVVSRRGFIQGVGIGGGAVELLQAKAASPALASVGIAGPGAVPITLLINGQTLQAHGGT